MGVWITLMEVVYSLKMLILGVFKENKKKNLPHPPPPPPTALPLNPLERSKEHRFKKCCFFVPRRPPLPKKIRAMSTQ